MIGYAWAREQAPGLAQLVATFSALEWPLLCCYFCCTMRRDHAAFKYLKLPLSGGFHAPLYFSLA